MKLCIHCKWYGGVKASNGKYICNHPQNMFTHPVDGLETTYDASWLRLSRNCKIVVAGTPNGGRKWAKMGKVFVHHPLKRAELKRLTAPPQPPIELGRIDFTPNGCDPEEKARRAAERAAARAEQERKLVKFREEVEMTKSIFKTVWIESYDFCTWMKERFNQDSELCDRITSEEVESILVDMFAVLDSKRCLYCGERAMKHAGDGWAGLMVLISPVGRITESREVFTYLLCNRCGKLSHKAIRHRAAETLVRKVRLGDETRAIRRSEFTPFDIQYFGDRFDVLIARDREQTIGFFSQLKESDMLANPELLDEFA